ncbi:hypothetical protein PHMEG_0002694 [Phytophthora megakarya]|uniref:Uncharacterized protein n=1 Tax=Phytophthora megakarya TaxID=4795 RepID=A0A225X062_9STRA|nr:hypothetical protein PHMEG_0002694 [Phytophthora megakarya]
MSVTPEDSNIPDLDNWLVRYCRATHPSGEQVGGWMVYQLQRDGSGVLSSAGSMSFESRGTPIDNAKWVLTRGMAEVNRITDPTQVLLRVESMEAAMSIPKTRTPANPHDTQYNCEIWQFFAVQWGKPHLNELIAGSHTP